MPAEILIIDDNADIRSILKDLIDDAGFKTRVAANYSQALAEIDKKLPDVAIIDVKLDKGDNDGIELLSHIKKKNKDIPVIIISGHAKGADSLAEQWAKKREVSLEIYPAEWDVYGKSAGFMRNQQMIDEGLPDLVVAFSGGKGTVNMIKLSNQANIPLYNVRDPMGWTGRGV